MKLSDLFSTSIRGVTQNTGRSLLTMLGIIIGVGSVVLMSGIGASMEGVILGQISSIGAKSMVIFPGNEEGGASAVQTGFDSLTLEDIEQLKQLDSIQHVAPVIFIPGRTTYGREQAVPQVFGIEPTFFQNQNIDIEDGRLFDAGENEGAKYVAVLAPDAREKLFGNADPIGKRIKIESNHYTVIGTTKALGSQFFQNADDRIYVPFETAKQVTGQRYVNYLTLEAKESFDIAFADIKYLLRQRHGIENPDDEQEKDDFIVRSSEQANEILSGVSLGLTMFITTIAGISLFVGGIGIMNIMLVTVTERTREIGLRKAVGAKRRDILLQFLIEAILLTVIGGCIGIALGLLFSFAASLAVRQFLDTYTFVISIGSIVAAFLMAVGTGLVFGISPARRAAALPPMEALRYE